MEVVLLGTGAADGWPNPFCTCASCERALADGDVRGSTGALVDDVLLLDCGPDAPRTASRAGRSLAGVRTVLLTHHHPDHLAPAALLWRSWAGRADMLEVCGPGPAIDACRDWLGPDDPVRLVSVTPGETVTPGGTVTPGDAPTGSGHSCTALAAAHEVSTMLWDVTGPDGARLLYATDTGPLPEDTLAAVAGRRYDLVLLEETFGDRTDHGTGHLDLDTFAAQLRRLHRTGAVHEATMVVAVHLGHHNPPVPELRRRLAELGADVLPDGAVIRVDPAGAVATTNPPHRPPQPPQPPQLPRLPRRTLLLGGARSGKSTEAERMLAGHTDVVYVATAGARAGDAEWDARILAHRARRPTTWTTVETLDLEALLGSDGPPLLVDCLSLWLTGVLDEVGAWEAETWHGDGAAAFERRLLALLLAWDRTTRRVVAVSNEVGSGVVPATWSGRLFRDQLGRLNTAVAARSDRVLLVVAGTVLQLRP